MKAYIDGDEIAFKISSLFQKKRYFVTKNGEKYCNAFNRDSGIEIACDDPEMDVDYDIEILKLQGHKEKIDMTLSRILKDVSASDYVFCLSGDNNFRYELATLLPYKGNRKDKEKPHYYFDIKNYLVNNYDCLSSKKNEADELMAYLSSKDKGSVICSSDKDLKTVPGRLYDIRKGKLYFISPQEAMYNFYFQMLIGDDTDNIPHPWLLGGKAAEAILSELDWESDLKESDVYNHVKENYIPYLTAKNSKDEYKTKWYSGQDVDEVLWEIGNLLWMGHEPGGKSRWSIPV